jgi:hypothetical protein
MKRFMIPVAALFIALLGSGFLLTDRSYEDVRKLNSFEGIGISISADVYYTQGNSHEIRIEGPERDVRDLKTEVKDDFLQIKFPSFKMKRAKLTIYVTSKSLEQVKLSGSGHFMAEKPVETEELDLAVSGSGTVVFSELASDEIGIKISGSGDVELDNGSADELDIRISGSGKVLGEGFKVSECSTSISGSGNVRITVTDELDARLSGSGKVYYKGNPQVNSISSGSGKVVEL